jgi:hypothetical protein
LTDIIQGRGGKRRGSGEARRAVGTDRPMDGKEF